MDSLPPGPKNGRCRDVSVTGGTTVCACSFFFSVCRKWTKIWIISALVSKQRTVIKKAAVPDKNEIQ